MPTDIGIGVSEHVSLYFRRFTKGFVSLLINDGGNKDFSHQLSCEGSEIRSFELRVSENQQLTKPRGYQANTSLS